MQVQQESARNHTGSQLIAVVGAAVATTAVAVVVVVVDSTAVAAVVAVVVLLLLLCMVVVIVDAAVNSCCNYRYTKPLYLPNDNQHTLCPITRNTNAVVTSYSYERYVIHGTWYTERGTHVCRLQAFTCKVLVCNCSWYF